MVAKIQLLFEKIVDVDFFIKLSYLARLIEIIFDL